MVADAAALLWMPRLLELIRSCSSSSASSVGTVSPGVEAALYPAARNAVVRKGKEERDAKREQRLKKKKNGIGVETSFWRLTFLQTSTTTNSKQLRPPLLCPALAAEGRLPGSGAPGSRSASPAEARRRRRRKEGGGLRVVGRGGGSLARRRRSRRLPGLPQAAR